MLAAYVCKNYSLSLFPKSYLLVVLVPVTELPALKIFIMFDV